MARLARLVRLLGLARLAGLAGEAAGFLGSLEKEAKMLIPGATKQQSNNGDKQHSTSYKHGRKQDWRHAR